MKKDSFDTNFKSNSSSIGNAAVQVGIELTLQTGLPGIELTLQTGLPGIELTLQKGLPGIELTLLRQLCKGIYSPF